MLQTDLSQQLSKLRLTSEAFDRAYFERDEYRTEDIISSTAEPFIKRRGTQNALHHSSDQHKRSNEQLLQTFRRLEAQLGSLSDRVLSADIATAHNDVSADAAAYVSRLDAAERDISKTQEQLHALESRADRLTSFSSRLGTRLVTADRQRQRALSAASALEHLQAFANSKDPTSLPSQFNDDSRMEESAAIVAKLSAAVAKIVESSESTGSHGSVGGSSLSSRRGAGPPELGSLAHAAEQLELYRNVLDNRIVSLFDAALQEQDFPSMARCVRVMAAGGPRGTGLLISRYVSTRSLFTNVDSVIVSINAAGEGVVKSKLAKQQQKQGEHAVGTSSEAEKDARTSSVVASSGAATHLPASSSGVLSPPTPDSDALHAMRSLSNLYHSLSLSLRDEALILEQVFPDAQQAMTVLVNRVFEQIVHTALSTTLTASPERKAGAEVLRSHLRLLAEAYRKTLALAEEAIELCGPGVGLSAIDLTDAACGSALENYLPLELEWLRSLGGAKLEGSKRILSQELILDLISMNEEAVKRCVLVMPAPDQLSGAVRTLFYCEQDASAGRPGCLLGQCAAHMLLGIGGAEARCVRRFAGGFGTFRSQPSTPGAQGAGADALHIARAARTDAAASVGILLRAIAEVTDICGCLKRHYDRIVLPHVAAAPAERAVCADGLAQLVGALDARFAVALESTMSQVFRRVTALLSAYQLKSDFRPVEYSMTKGVGAGDSMRSSSSVSRGGVGVVDYKGGGATAAAAAAMDRPTTACTAVVALLEAVGEQAVAHLHGSNLSSFLTELSCRTAAAVEAHALRFTFSPEGALRWRRDITEYAECMTSRLGARGSVSAFEDIQALASLLFVAPESLPGLLDGMLHLDKKRLANIVARREDFKTAKIRDRPLSSLVH